jgi:endonuclease YncB( thermonuclease family)
VLIGAGAALALWRGLAPEPMAGTRAAFGEPDTPPAPRASAPWSLTPRIVPPDEKREPTLPPRQGSIRTYDPDVIDLSADLRVEDPLTLRDGAIRIRLADLEGLAPADFCPGINGGRFACGRRAIVALHNLVFEQQVTCARVAVLDPDTVSARCWTQRGQTINARLVADGWARPLPDAMERYAEAIAERCRRGRDVIAKLALCPPPDRAADSGLPMR